MQLKTQLINPLIKAGIEKFILIGENIFNFHGSDDCYYEEWYDDVEEGWIVALNFRDFVLKEMSNYQIDSYFNFAGRLDSIPWRTYKPELFCQIIDSEIAKRLQA
jgi:hypothetical protein